MESEIETNLKKLRSFRAFVESSILKLESRQNDANNLKLERMRMLHKFILTQNEKSYKRDTVKKMLQHLTNLQQKYLAKPSAKYVDATGNQTSSSDNQNMEKLSSALDKNKKSSEADFSKSNCNVAKIEVSACSPVEFLSVSKGTKTLNKVLHCDGKKDEFRSKEEIEQLSSKLKKISAVESTEARYSQNRQERIRNLFGDDLPIPSSKHTNKSECGSGKSLIKGHSGNMSSMTGQIKAADPNSFKGVESTMNFSAKHFSLQHSNNDRENDLFMSSDSNQQPKVTNSKDNQHKSYLISSSKSEQIPFVEDQPFQKFPDVSTKHFSKQGLNEHSRGNSYDVENPFSELVNQAAASCSAKSQFHESRMKLRKLVGLASYPVATETPVVGPVCAPSPHKETRVKLPEELQNIIKSCIAAPPKPDIVLDSVLDSSSNSETLLKVRSSSILKLREQLSRTKAEPKQNPIKPEAQSTKSDDLQGSSFSDSSGLKVPLLSQSNVLKRPLQNLNCEVDSESIQQSKSNESLSDLVIDSRAGDHHSSKSNSNDQFINVTPTISETSDSQRVNSPVQFSNFDTPDSPEPEVVSVAYPSAESPVKTIPTEKVTSNYSSHRSNSSLGHLGAPLSGSFRYEDFIKPAFLSHNVKLDRPQPSVIDPAIIPKPAPLPSSFLMGDIDSSPLKSSSGRGQEPCQDRDLRVVDKDSRVYQTPVQSSKSSTKVQSGSLNIEEYRKRRALKMNISEVSSNISSSSPTYEGSSYRSDISKEQFSRSSTWNYKPSHSSYREGDFGQSSARPHNLKYLPQASPGVHNSYSQLPLSNPASNFKYSPGNGMSSAPPLHHSINVPPCQVRNDYISAGKDPRGHASIRPSHPSIAAGLRPFDLQFATSLPPRGFGVMPSPNPYCSSVGFQSMFGTGMNYPRPQSPTPPPLSAGSPEPVKCPPAIAKTFTCIIMRGLPHFSTSLHIYKFLKDYILSDVVIEIDHALNCTGTAYIQFPSHEMAEDCLLRFNGYIMHGFQIILSAVAFGFFKGAKQQYDARNAERELRLGITPMPQGNCNPFYEPKRVQEKRTVEEATKAVVDEPSTVNKVEASVPKDDESGDKEKMYENEPSDNRPEEESIVGAEPGLKMKGNGYKKNRRYAKILIASDSESENEEAPDQSAEETILSCHKHSDEDGIFDPGISNSKLKNEPSNDFEFPDDHESGSNAEGNTSDKEELLEFEDADDDVFEPVDTTTDDAATDLPSQAVAVKHTEKGRLAKPHAIRPARQTVVKGKKSNKDKKGNISIKMTRHVHQEVQKVFTESDKIKVLFPLPKKYVQSLIIEKVPSLRFKKSLPSSSVICHDKSEELPEVQQTVVRNSRRDASFSDRSDGSDRDDLVIDFDESAKDADDQINNHKSKNNFIPELNETKNDTVERNRSRSCQQSKKMGSSVVMVADSTMTDDELPILPSNANDPTDYASKPVKNLPNLPPANVPTDDSKIDSVYETTENDSLMNNKENDIKHCSDSVINLDSSDEVEITDNGKTDATNRNLNTSSASSSTAFGASLHPSVCLLDTSFNSSLPITSRDKIISIAPNTIVSECDSETKTPARSGKRNNSEIVDNLCDLEPKRAKLQSPAVNTKSIQVCGDRSLEINSHESVDIIFAKSVQKNSGDDGSDLIEIVPSLESDEELLASLRVEESLNSVPHHRSTETLPFAAASTVVNVLDDDGVVAISENVEAIVDLEKGLHSISKDKDIAVVEAIAKSLELSVERDLDLTSNCQLQEDNQRSLGDLNNLLLSETSSVYNAETHSDSEYKNERGKQNTQDHNNELSAVNAEANSDVDDASSVGIASVSSFADDLSVVSAELDSKTPEPHMKKRRKKDSKNNSGCERRRLTRGTIVEATDTSEVVRWDDGGVVDLFQCDLCEYVGRQHVSHIVNCHSGREVNCAFKKEDVATVFRDKVGPPEATDSQFEVDLSWIPEQLLFDCPILCNFDDCAYESTIRFDLLYHYLKHVPEAAPTMYHCRLCNHMTNDLVSSYDHFASHTGEYRHMCMSCGYLTYSQALLVEHCQKNHDQVVLKSCDLVLEDNWPYIYICKACLHTQIQVSNIHIHITQKHNGRAEIHKANMFRHISLNNYKKSTSLSRAAAGRNKKATKKGKGIDANVFIVDDIDDEEDDVVEIAAQELVERVGKLSRDSFGHLAAKSQIRISQVEELQKKLKQILDERSNMEEERELTPETAPAPNEQDESHSDGRAVPEQDKIITNTVEPASINVVTVKESDNEKKTRGNGSQISGEHEVSVLGENFKIIKELGEDSLNSNLNNKLKGSWDKQISCGGRVDECMEQISKVKDLVLLQGRCKDSTESNSGANDFSNTENEFTKIVGETTELIGVDSSNFGLTDVKTAEDVLRGAPRPDENSLNLMSTIRRLTQNLNKYSALDESSSDSELEDSVEISDEDTVSFEEEYDEQSNDALSRSPELNRAPHESSLDAKPPLEGCSGTQFIEGGADHTEHNATEEEKPFVSTENAQPTVSIVNALSTVCLDVTRQTVSTANRLSTVDPLSTASTIDIKSIAGVVSTPSTGSTVNAPHTASIADTSFTSSIVDTLSIASAVITLPSVSTVDMLPNASTIDTQPTDAISAVSSVSLACKLPTISSGSSISTSVPPIIGTVPNVSTAPIITVSSICTIPNIVTASSVSVAPIIVESSSASTTAMHLHSLAAPSNSESTCCSYKECCFTATSLKEISEHEALVHGPFKCSLYFCNFITHSEEQFVVHHQTHPQNIQLNCGYLCSPLKFSNVEELISHYKKDHVPLAVSRDAESQASVGPRRPALEDECFLKIESVSTMDPLAAKQVFGEGVFSSASTQRSNTNSKMPQGSTTLFPSAAIYTEGSSSSTSSVFTSSPPAPMPDSMVVSVKQEPKDADDSLALPPGVDTLPQHPPTVPIFYVFQRYQSLEAFKVYTSRRAPDVFKCMSRNCVYSCNSPSQFTEHAKQHNGSQICCYCLVKLQTAEELVAHVTEEHSHCGYMCKHCLYRSIGTSYLGSHMKHFHPLDQPRYIKVSTINKQAPPNPPVEKFIHAYQCGYDGCLRRTVDADLFRHHVDGTHGPDAILRCFLCSFEGTVIFLIKHMRVHMMDEFQCPYCLYGESVREKLLTHLVNCHPGRSGKVLLRKQDHERSSVKINPLSSQRSVDVGPRPAANAVKASRVSPEGSTSSVASSAPPKAPTSPAFTLSATDDAADGNEAKCCVRQTRRSAQQALSTSEDGGSLKRHLSDSELATPDKTGLAGHALYRCGNNHCSHSSSSLSGLREHLLVCDMARDSPTLRCFHCGRQYKQSSALLEHLKVHGVKRYTCGVEGCSYRSTMLYYFRNHMRQTHTTVSYKAEVIDSSVQDPDLQQFVVFPSKEPIHKKRKNEYEVGDEIPRGHVSYIPLRCYHCLFSTKIRLNLIKHLKLHEKYPDGIPERPVSNINNTTIVKTEVSSLRPIPMQQPINPVPCLERREMMFDKMMNLAGSTFEEKKKIEEVDLRSRNPIPPEELETLPKFVPEACLNACGVEGCEYISSDEIMLKYHIRTLHSEITIFSCPHCKTALTVEKLSSHFKLHGERLYRCGWCSYLSFRRAVVERHTREKHPSKRPFEFVIRDPEDEKIKEELNKEPEVITLDGVPQANSETPQWQCGLCRFQSVTQQAMVNHTSVKHDVKSQYKCGHCSTKSSVLSSIEAHYATKHPTVDMKVLCMYYRLDADNIVPLDKSDGKHEPLWKRNDPYRMRHIRGILLDEGKGGNFVTAKIRQQVPLEDVPPGLPENENYVCPKCLSFRNSCENTFRAHLCKEADYHRYECGECGFTSPLLPTLRRHFNRTHHCPFHNDSYLVMPIDDEKEAWVESIITHQKHHIELFKHENNVSDVEDASSPLVGSPQGSGRATRRSAVQEEIAGTSDEMGPIMDKNLTCDVCSAVCKSSCGLYNHVKASHSPRYRCGQCSFALGSRSLVEVHCKQKHGNLCQTVVDTSVNMTQESSAVETSDYVDESKSTTKACKGTGRIRKCPDCEFQTLSSSMFYKHCKSHVTTRPYVCEICNIRFRDMRAGKQHCNLTHGNTHNIVFRPVVSLPESPEKPASFAGQEPALKSPEPTTEPKASTVNKPTFYIDEEFDELPDLESSSAVLPPVKQETCSLPKMSASITNPTVEQSRIFFTSKTESKQSLSTSKIKVDGTIPNTVTEPSNMFTVSEIEPDLDSTEAIFICCHCSIKSEFSEIANHLQSKHKDLPFLVRKQTADELTLQIYKYQCDHCSLEADSFTELIAHWVKGHVKLEFKFNTVLHVSHVIDGPKKKTEEEMTKTKQPNEVQESKLNQSTEEDESGSSMRVTRSARGMVAGPQPPAKKPRFEASDSISSGLSSSFSEEESDMTSETSDVEVAVKVFRCSGCRRTSKVREEILIHQAEKHASSWCSVIELPSLGHGTHRRLMKCRVCSLMGFSQVVIQHGRETHPDLAPPFVVPLLSTDREVFRCDLCQFSSRTRKVIQRHMSSQHPDHLKSFSRFAESSNTAELPSSSAAEQSAEVSDRKYRCVYCRDLADSLELLQSHHTFLHSHLPFLQNSIEYYKTSGADVHAGPSLSSVSPIRRHKSFLSSSTGKPLKATARKSTRGPLLHLRYSNDSDDDVFKDGKRSSLKNDEQGVTSYGKPRSPVFLENISSRVDMGTGSPVKVNALQLCTLFDLDPKIVLADVAKALE